jgi:hypothetical protein
VNKCGVTNPRSEGRNPKEFRNPKPEGRIRAFEAGNADSDFGFRPSFGLRVSGLIDQALVNLLLAQPLALVQNLIASFIWPHCEQRERSTSGSSV